MKSCTILSYKKARVQCNMLIKLTHGGNEKQFNVFKNKINVVVSMENIHLNLFESRLSIFNLKNSRIMPLSH